MIDWKDQLEFEFVNSDEFHGNRRGPDPLGIGQEDYPIAGLDPFIFEGDSSDGVSWTLDENYELGQHSLVGELPGFLNKRFLMTDWCPICDSRYRRFATPFEEEVNGSQSLPTWFHLSTCENCTHWQLYAGEVWDGEFPSLRQGLPTPPSAFDLHLGKLRRFDPRIPEGCYGEMARLIKRDPKKWHEVEPTALERMVAEIFKANYDRCEVTHVGRPDDGGVDVVFVQSATKEWLIQVKRRQNPSAVEGVATIRNLLGTMFLEGKTHGIVVSTVDHFSYRAQEAAARAGELGMKIRLVDRTALDRMIGPLALKPWSTLLNLEYGEPGWSASRRFLKWHREIETMRKMGLKT